MGEHEAMRACKRWTSAAGLERYWRQALTRSGGLPTQLWRWACSAWARMLCSGGSRWTAGGRAGAAAGLVQPWLAPWRRLQRCYLPLHTAAAAPVPAAAAAGSLLACCSTWLGGKQRRTRCRGARRAPFCCCRPAATCLQTLAGSLLYSNEARITADTVLRTSVQREGRGRGGAVQPRAADRE